MFINSEIFDRLKRKDITLASVDLSNKKLTSSDIENLAGLLINNTSVVELNLSSNSLDDNAVQSLSTIFKKNITLKIINLDNNRIGDTGATILVLAIINKGETSYTSYRSQTEGHIGSSRYGGHTSKAQITSISLRQNKIGERGATNLTEIETLETLLLDSNSITDKAVTWLVRHKKLKKLGLKNNRIGNEGMLLLANSSISELEISGNIDNSRFSYAARRADIRRPNSEAYHPQLALDTELMFLKNTSIKRLDIQLPIDISTLWRLRNNDTTLTLLDLSHWNLTDEHVAILFNVLKSNTTVTELILSHNRLTFCSFAFLENNKTLQLLNLDNNELLEWSVTKQNIRELSLNFNPILRCATIKTENLLQLNLDGVKSLTGHDRIIITEKINKNIKQKIQPLLENKLLTLGLNELIYKLICATGKVIKNINALEQALSTNNQEKVYEFIIDLLRQEFLHKNFQGINISKFMLNNEELKLLFQIIKNNPISKSIIFSNCKIEPDIAHIISQDLNIENLDFSNCTLTDNVLAILAKIPTLTTLIISEKTKSSISIDEDTIMAFLQNKRFANTNLDLPVDMNILHKIRTNDPGVTRLFLNNKKINDVLLSLLCDSIENNTHLKDLIISNNQITDLGVQQIVKIRNLRKLDLRNNQLTDKGAPLLAQHPTLEELDIADNLLTAIGVEILEGGHLKKINFTRISTDTINNLEINDKFLTTLDMESEKLINQDLSILCMALKNNDALTKLKLSNNKIDNTGAKLLSNLENRISIDLSNNLIEDQGAKLLANNMYFTGLTLTGNTKITQAAIIDLLRDKKERPLRIDSRIPQELAYKIIINDEKLTHVNLSNKNINDNDLFVLVELLDDNTNVIDFDLSYNKITQQGVKFLKKLNNITALKLNGNNIADTADDLLQIKSLKILGVYSCSLDEGNIIKLIKNGNFTHLQAASNLPYHLKFENLNLEILKNKTLVEIDIHEIHIGFDLMRKIRSSDPSLTKLDLSNKNITDPVIAILLEALNDNANIIELDLSNNNITDESAMILAQAKYLTTLKLTANKITDVGVTKLATNIVLTHLDISHNKHSNDIVKILAQMSNLKTLAIYKRDLHLQEESIISLLENKHLTDIDFQLPINLNIMQRIRRNDPTLTSISLSSSALTDACIFILCKALEENTYVNTVYLSNCNVGTNGIKALAKVSSITSLTIKQNLTSITTESIQHLADNKNLKILNLEGNNLHDNDIIPFLQNNTLLELYLNSNNLTVVGAQTLALNLSVILLDLGNNNIGDAGALSLSSNTRLIELRLAHCQISDGGCQALTKNMSFLIVDLEGNQISTNIKAELKTQLEKNQQATNLLIIACKSQQLNNVIACLKNARPFGNYISNILDNKDTLLHLAVRYKNQAILDQLLIHNADVDASKLNKDGFTYLSLAENLNFNITPTIIPKKSETIQISQAGADKNTVQLDLEELKIMIATLIEAVNELKGNKNSGTKQTLLDRYHQVIAPELEKVTITIPGINCKDNMVIINHARLDSDKEADILNLINRYAKNCQIENITRNATGNINTLKFDNEQIIKDLQDDLFAILQKNNNTLEII